MPVRLVVNPSPTSSPNSQRGWDLRKTCHNMEVHDAEAELRAFLCCTLRSTCTVSKIRGLDHVLKQIWTLVCEEWWDLHVVRFGGAENEIADLTMPWQRRNIDPRDNSRDIFRRYPEIRQSYGGCPVAIIAKKVSFPDPTVVPLGTFLNQGSEDLCINMMPFVLRDEGSLPACCRQYWPLVKLCADRQYSYGVGYLTIDERPAAAGKSQRRGGLHIESPGFLPVVSGVKSQDGGTDGEGSDATESRFVPGVEHMWGMGVMSRDETVEGGVFMASSVAGTTAVWNCLVNNEGGSVVGKLGNIERLRPILGPCARTLGAGELVWMTDRTPHESLPVPAGTRRQYFRLVVGTVTAWYADHSTPNPLGYLPDPAVHIIHGDKFALYASVPSGLHWHCGNAVELHAAREFAVVQALLCEYGMAHLRQRFQDYGCTSLHRIVALEQEQTDAQIAEHNSFRALWGATPTHERSAQGGIWGDFFSTGPSVYVGWGADFSADGRTLFAGHADSIRYEANQMVKLVAKAKEMVKASESSKSVWYWLWGK